MAGAVQHGASTLPDELFHRFPQVETAEVHLATGFTNLLLDHPRFPAGLLSEMRAYCDREHADERVAGETDGQFFYKTRKKVWGPFKRRTWDLPEDIRAELNAGLQAKFEFLIRQLSAAGRRDVTMKHVVQKPATYKAPLVASRA